MVNICLDLVEINFTNICWYPVMSVSVSPPARGWGMSVVMIARTFYYGDNKDAAATLSSAQGWIFLSN